MGVVVELLGIVGIGASLQATRCVEHQCVQSAKAVSDVGEHRLDGIGVDEISLHCGR